MSDRRSIVLARDRHLKWRALDGLEAALMVFCGLAIAGFSLCVVLDIVTRTLGAPWLWLQEVTRRSSSTAASAAWRSRRAAPTI